VTRDQAVLLAVGGLIVVCVFLVVALVSGRAKAARAASDLAELRARLDLLEHRPAAMPAARAAAPVEFVITDLGRADPAPEPVHLDGPAFTDLVLKETVVKAASFAQGLRRGLAPATRNRIRFEMRQEVRRARKQRRADLKAAQRDLHARQRAALVEEAS
jgi:outer membrane murein-binding lipoprotein Lpp